MLDFLKRNYRWILLVLFILISVQILTLDISAPTKSGLVTRFILTASSYPLRATRSVKESLKDLWFGYVYLVGVKKENKFLRSRIDQLMEENQKLKVAVLENERFKKLLNFTEVEERKFTVARVIGISLDEGKNVFIVDRGKSSGIERNSAVVVPEGVVGRVFRLSETSAEVMLVTDQRSFIDVRFERTRVHGILHGTGSGGEVEFVNRDEDVVEGDRVLTSGLGGVFPEGFLVGSVTAVETSSLRMFKKIKIAPAADINRLDEVLIVSHSEEKDAKH